MAKAQQMAVGQELARLRKEAGLRQEDVAVAVGRTDSRISQIERGDWLNTPDTELISRYVDFCLKHVGGAKELRDRRRRHVLGLFEGLDALADALPPRPCVNQLRRDIDTFTGRSGELARLRASVARAMNTGGVIAVHAVDGKPGVGKSAFATHAAHGLRHKFPDAQLFLDLHGHSAKTSPMAPAEALASLLGAVGVPGRALPAALDDRSALWRSRMADQSGLLILDNALDEEQVRPLLPNAPGCLVLVTSRRRMVGLNAVTIAIDVLPSEEAVQMFRAVVRHDIPEDAPVGELVALCGYLPLAIELVGGRMRNRKSLTVGRLVTEVRESVNRLASMRVRNHHVAAAFELSYRALSSYRQSFFRTLGLHPGSDVDAYAGAALTAESLEEVKRQLQGLYDDNLLDEHVYGRYQLHDLIAEYLRDVVARTDLGVRKRSLDRLLDYYQDTAVLADRLLKPGYGVTYASVYDGPLPALDERRSAMDWLSLERENLLSSLRVSAENPSRVLTLTAAMSRHLRLSGPWDVAVRLHQDAVAAARSVGSTDGEARSLLELGTAHRNHGDYEAAARCVDEASAAYATLGDDSGRAAALLEDGTVRWLTGSYEPARKRLAEALALSRSAGDREGEADALVELGTLAYVLDEYEDAERQLSAALALYEDLGDDQGRVAALKNLGSTWYFMDKYDAAEKALQQSLTLARDLGNTLVEAQALTKLGSVLRLMGRYEDAVQRLTDARELARRLADRSLEAELLIDLGAALHRLGKGDAAVRAFGDSLGLYETLGEDLGRACALKEFGDALADTGRLDEGRARLEEARSLDERLGERLGLAAVWNSFGKLELRAGAPAASAAAHWAALTIAREIGGPLEEAAALLGLGNAARACGDHVEARARIDASLTIYRRIGAAEAEDVSALLARSRADETCTSEGFRTRDSGESNGTVFER
ncbi:tetratricopeptide repeat protein [Streptomyces sp. NPDC006430]|uniref:tetratricopeptide repeat protein n=1 Tax=Streptomyces sp. NPDC006430 TaxID=3154299 RepID=UPI0033BC2448